MKIYPEHVINNINENYMIGKLAVDTSDLPHLGIDSEPVTITEFNEVIFYIKPLSTEPLLIEEVQRQSFNMSEYYIGFASKTEIKNINDLDIRYLSPNEKADFLKKKLSNKLILFKPLLNQETKKERYHKNISWLKILDKEWEKDEKYEAIPKFNIEHDDFEKMILSGQSIELEQYTNAMPLPKYLLCNNYLYGDIRNNNWREDSTNNKSYMLLEPEVIKRIDFQKDAYQKLIIDELEDLIFVNDKLLSDVIDSKIQNKGLSLEEIKQQNEKKEQNNLVTESLIQDHQSTRMIDEDLKLPEIDFIDFVEAFAISKKLFYSRQDIVNFHVSIKSSAFTILSGQSGIGKTQLAILYAEALGLRQGENLLIMPISPAYTEPADILGFLNPNTGLYTPADTGLVDFLLHAEKNRDEIHMLILDEINLSQIEHYFSPFLSLLELDEDKRILSLYNEEDTCHNRATYTPNIRLYDNIIIVGTMNTDETTKELSDRLLDRSTLVELEKQPFTEIRKQLTNKDNYKSLLEELDRGTDIAYGRVYINWINKSGQWEVFTEEELEFFEEIDQLISTYDEQKGFSIRNLMRMGQYLVNIPKNHNNELEIERSLAIDLFIKQRVITKLRGPIDIYEPLIGTDFDNLDEQGKLIKLFKNAQDISDFKYTLNELKRKSEELKVHGYIF